MFNLPAESALAHSSGQEWTAERELQAQTVEVLYMAWLQLRVLCGDKTVRDAKPYRVRHPSRPGNDEAGQPKKVTMADLMRQQQKG